MEAANVAEDFDEDFLRNVGGVGGVLQATRDQRIERLMILRNQLSKRALGTGAKIGY